jgi:glu/leu/phe/val dehydrogenase
MRIIPEASVQETAELARAMTQKLKLFGVPVGGAKALVAPRRGYSFADMREDIAEIMQPFLESGFLLGEDVGTTSDEIREIYTINQIDPIKNTLQIVERRGIKVETPAAELEELLTADFSGQLAGRGVVIVLDAFIQRNALPYSPVEVSIQGAGSVGGTTARLLAERSEYKVVALCDADALIQDPEGISRSWLDRHIHARGSLKLTDLTPTASIKKPQDWLKTKAHILVAAAVRDAINFEIAESLPNEIVCVIEAANLAVTSDAADKLKEIGIAVIPGALASAFTSVCFGLLATGQANLNNVEAVYRERVNLIMEGLQ